MNKMIAASWQAGKLPGINSLVKNTGEVILLTCSRNKEGISLSTPLCSTTIESLNTYNESLWTEVNVHQKMEDPFTNTYFCIGESTMGHEGFIVCADEHTNFIWGFFFEDSNPFTHVDFDEQYIYSFSTSNYIYCLDRRNIEYVTIKFIDY